MRLLWQQIPSTIISEIFASAKNFDGVVLDTEHSPYNEETLFSCIQVIKLSGKKCFVRLPYLDRSRTKICMDAGCDGLIFSTIETDIQAKEIFEFCKYPGQSRGGRRGQGLVRENGWGTESLGLGQPILIGQIETLAGVSVLHSIESLRVFDMYLIGPYDLSASLGHVGDFDCSLYQKAIDKIRMQIDDSRLGIHIPKNVEDSLPNYNSFGFKALGMDTTFLLDRIEEL